jgi:hypothetical protein
VSGAANALSHEGCRHFEAFDQGNKDFDAGVFRIEDDMLKCSAGVLYDRMWGPHGHGVVRERANRALAHVCFGFGDGVVSVCVAEPPKLLGPHAPVIVSKASDGYACAPDNLTGSVRVSQGPQINHL